MTAAGFAMSLPPVIATRVPCGRCAMVLRSLRARWKSRASIAAEVSLPVCEVCDPRRRPPHAAGLDPVGVGGCVAHGLEGVAPVALRPASRAPARGLDLGAVLFALEVAQAGHQLVGGAVEALGLGVEHVDEAPQQALAFVG